MEPFLEQLDAFAAERNLLLGEWQSLGIFYLGFTHVVSLVACGSHLTTAWVEELQCFTDFCICILSFLSSLFDSVFFGFV